MLKPLNQLLSEYQVQHKAIPAFNIDSFEIYQAVENAVKSTSLPCIVQLSSSEDDFIQAERLFMLVKKAQMDGLSIYLNMDHGRDQKRLENLISLGFDMVHLDGSNLDYSTNLEFTKNFITKVKQVNPSALIEVEFSKIEMVEKTLSPDSLTNPQKALEFINATQGDLLAVAVGNLHGVSTQINEVIDLNLLQNIKNILNDNCFLTLHGGSGITQSDLISAINIGIVKININTDLRLKFKSSLLNSLSTTSSIKIYEYMDPVIKDLETIIINKLKFLYQPNN